jgi:hypothetical protein
MKTYLQGPPIFKRRGKERMVMGRAHASIPLFLKKGSIFKIGLCLRGFYGRAIKHKA